MQELKSSKRPVPKIGVLINSIEVFNPAAKDKTEAALKAYFDNLIASGAIDKESIIRGRIFGPHEATAAANDFAAAQVDAVVVSNVAFPNGHVFLTLATHPNLAKTPLVVIAEPEPEGDEWATNAWCGAIMNNYVAKQIGRHVEIIPGRIGSDEFNEGFHRMLKVAATIRFLRNDLVVRFGDAPSGFHSATGNQLAFAESFGTRVDTVDLSAVLHVYKTGKAEGYLGESTFTDADVKATAAEMKEGRQSIEVSDEVMEQAARFYHAFRAIIRANGYTSCSVRCWPEFQGEVIPPTPCISQSWLLVKGDVAAVACEGDWPMAIAQTMGTMLSDKPAVCMDWINYTADSNIIQLGHCGVGMGGYMATTESGCTGICDAIALHPVSRQAGGDVQPANIGQFMFGSKTGICLSQGPDGWFRLLAFSGESSAETAKGLKYIASDIKFDKYKELNQAILDYGFPHHVAMAFGDITKDLEMLCRFLGVEFVAP